MVVFEGAIRSVFVHRPPGGRRGFVVGGNQHEGPMADALFWTLPPPHPGLTTAACQLRGHPEDVLVNSLVNGST